MVETTEHAEIVESVRGELSELTEVWVFDDGGLDQLNEAGVGIDDAEVDARRAGVDLDDLASIIYTSGTTGPAPRAASSAHR